MRVGDRRTATRAWARADCPAATWDPFFFAASAGMAANARAAAASTASDIRRIFIPNCSYGLSLTRKLMVRQGAAGAGLTRPEVPVPSTLQRIGAFLEPGAKSLDRHQHRDDELVLRRHHRI